MGARRQNSLSPFLFFLHVPLGEKTYSLFAIHTRIVCITAQTNVPLPCRFGVEPQHHASTLPSGLQAQKSTTRWLLKLLVSNCKTSAEKLPDFSAEVAEVLLSVSQTSRKGFSPVGWSPLTLWHETCIPFSVKKKEKQTFLLLSYCLFVTLPREVIARS